MLDSRLSINRFLENTKMMSKREIKIKVKPNCKKKDKIIQGLKILVETTDGRMYLQNLNNSLINNKEGIIIDNFTSLHKNVFHLKVFGLIFFT